MISSNFHLFSHSHPHRDDTCRVTSVQLSFPETGKENARVFSVEINREAGPVIELHGRNCCALLIFNGGFMSRISQRHECLFPITLKYLNVPGFF